MAAADSPIFEPDAQGSTEAVGAAIDDGRGRIFPCEKCGADLVFSIGQQSLACPYCGAVKQLTPPADAAIVENDYAAALEQVRAVRKRGEDAAAVTGFYQVRCESCGANVVFQGTLTSSTCPYCASPLQRDKVHDAESRVRVDGVLPFLVPQERAAAHLRDWVRSRWFAPNEFKQLGVQGKFHGCYFPYFTYDALTFTRYEGQRGDHYWETVGSGKDERRVQRTAWTYKFGEFQRLFDDVLVVAASADSADLLQALEPWPLGKCVPFTQEVLAGFYARTYDVPLDEGFRRAKQRIEAALDQDVRQRIGGDEQQVTSQKTAYSAITYKHLLLPVWLLAYRYKEKTYRVTINAATGEVHGERPYSWVKITLFVLLCAALALLLVALTQR